jgi:hypothetical protein
MSVRSSYISPSPVKQQQQQVSEERLPSELDAFSTFPTQVGIQRSEAEKLQPVTGLDRSGPISFHIPASEDQIDPANLFILMMAKIVHKKDFKNIPLTVPDPADGAAPPIHNVNRCVLPVNGMLSSLFKNCTVKVNNTVINKVENMYGYRADIETRLGFCQETKKGSLSLCLFDEETEPFEDLDADKLDLIWNKEGPMGRRFYKTAGSKYIRLVAPVHQEIFQQGKLLPPFTSLDISFDRQRPEFSLLTNIIVPDGYAVDIVWTNLLVRHVTVEPEIKENTEKLVVSKRLKRIFPLRSVGMRSYGFARGTNKLCFRNVIQGKLPRKVIFGLVDSEAFHGDMTKDPYNFQHFKASHIAVRASGAPVHYQELEVDFDVHNTLYFMGLFQLLFNCNALFNPTQDLGINTDNYTSRNVLYAFDLTPSGPCRKDNEMFELGQNGTVDIEMSLDTPLTQNVTMVVYLESDGELLMDADNNASISNLQDVTLS